MALTIERLKKFRRRFAWGFAVSVVLMVMVLLFAVLLESESSFLDSASLLAVASVLSSFTTFIGLLVTTLITWRKERRENDHASIELEKNKLELEKLRREVADKNIAAQARKNKMSKRRRIG
jgi:hypothetical protein